MGVNVIIADGDPVFRAGIGSLLSSEPDFVVVGEASTTQEMLELASQLAPDLLLMDVFMSGASSLDMLDSILRVRPKTWVVILTAMDADEYLVEAFRRGAQGYILKATPWPRLLRALRALQNGEVALSRQMTTRVVRAFQLPFSATYAREAKAVAQLTIREQAILLHLATGASNQEIARQLVISTHTVKVHVRNILAKLGVKNRAQAGGVAQRHWPELTSKVEPDASDLQVWQREGALTTSRR